MSIYLKNVLHDKFFSVNVTFHSDFYFSEEFTLWIIKIYINFNHQYIVVGLTAIYD